MEHTKIVLSTALYYCYHIGDHESDEKDILGFLSVNGDDGLTIFLKKGAFPSEDAGTARTYLVRSKVDDGLVAYFTLKAGLVSFSERHGNQKTEFDTIPGVEISNFAVNGQYRARHPKSKGCGNTILTTVILPIIREAAKVIGIYAVYIFSVPEEKVVQNYYNYGFRRLPKEDEALLHSRLKPTYDQDCIFMWMRL